MTASWFVYSACGLAIGIFGRAGTYVDKFGLICGYVMPSTPVLISPAAASRSGAGERTRYATKAAQCRAIGGNGIRAPLQQDLVDEYGIASRQRKSGLDAGRDGPGNRRAMVERPYAPRLCQAREVAVKPESEAHVERRSSPARGRLRRDCRVDPNRDSPRWTS